MVYFRFLFHQRPYNQEPKERRFINVQHGVRPFSLRLLTALALLLSAHLGCLFQKDGIPNVIRSSRITSPNSQWDAVLDTVDNGLGFGMGLLYEEVHLERKGAVPLVHGDPGKTVIFYVEKADYDHNEVTASWTDSSHLVIEYAGNETYGPRVPMLGNVSITFHQISKPSTIGPPGKAPMPSPGTPPGHP